MDFKKSLRDAIEAQMSLDKEQNLLPADVVSKDRSNPKPNRQVGFPDSIYHDDSPLWYYARSDIRTLCCKNDQEHQLTGWYKVRGKNTLKVCMESPYMGFSKCEEIDWSKITRPNEVETMAKQCLLKLYEEALEIIQRRDKFETVIAEFHRAVENKGQKRERLEKRLERATDDVSKCMLKLLLDRYDDNQCELYDILEKEGVLIDTDLSNIFIMLRHCKNRE